MIYVLKITKLYLVHKYYSIIKFKDKIVTLKYQVVCHYKRRGGRNIIAIDKWSDGDNILYLSHMRINSGINK